MKKWIAIVVAMGVLGSIVAGCGGKKAEQVKYPTKPITILVPYAAGGAADLMVRIIEPSLSKRLGQPVVVVNKPADPVLLLCWKH